MPALAERLTAERVAGAWPRLVGADVARRARPRGLAGGVLTVVVDNSPWLSELTLRAADVTTRVRAAFPSVTSIRLTLGTLPAEPPPPPSPPAEAAPLDPADVREIDRAASAIIDPTLAAAARRLLHRAWRDPGVRGASR